MKNIVENQDIKTDKPLAMSYEALKADRDALALCCSLYREAISKARRLINVDEMGDADDVLAQAERELSSHDAALAAIQAQAKAEAIEQLIGRKKRELADMHPDTHAFGMTSALIRNQIRCLESFATELREAK
ncbi:hypothetical protein [Serratia marcescens]|uniref:hypothetical protein n=1 Tax=Serratia marcescens TaxID=615 RepID=UPI0036FA7BAE